MLGAVNDDDIIEYFAIRIKHKAHAGTALNTLYTRNNYLFCFVRKLR